MTGDGDGTCSPAPSTPAAPPHRVRIPVNVHRWDDIAFLHWPFEPADVAKVLPGDLTVLTWEGMAWVGVTPFVMRVRPPVGPAPPGWDFPETNLRTYVTGPDGRQGLWFLHMEVPARWFVAALRSLGLPYHRRHMAVRSRDGLVSYRSRPPRDGQQGGHDIAVRPGAVLDPPEGGDFEQFLTARWSAYHRRGTLLRTPVEHPPWELHTAEVETCDVAALFTHVGLTAPTAAPIAHWSAGVNVRVGWPRLVR